MLQATQNCPAGTVIILAKVICARMKSFVYHIDGLVQDCSICNVLH